MRSICVRFTSFSRVHTAALLFPLLLTLCSVSLADSPGTLSTRFTTVVMEDVPIGCTVAPRLPDGAYYSVRNDSGRALQVRLNPERPGYCEPVPGEPGYAPLPDGRWIHFDPAVIDLPPHSQGESLITVAIPDDPAHYGKRYEFWVRASAEVGPSGVALLSRVRLQMRGAPAAVEAEPPGGDAPAPAEDAAEAAPPAPEAPADVAEIPRAPVVVVDEPPRRPFWGRLKFW